jgi:hypothetical protein
MRLPAAQCWDPNTGGTGFFAVEKCFFLNFFGLFIISLRVTGIADFQDIIVLENIVTSGIALADSRQNR